LNVDGSYNSEGGIGAGDLIQDKKGNWHIGFASNDGQGDLLFAELFVVYHGITLLLQDGYSREIIESDSLEALQSLSRRNKLEFHVYNSLLLRIASSIDYALNLVLYHVFQEVNYSVFWLAKYGNPSAVGVTTWFSSTFSLLDQLCRDALCT